MRVAARNTDRRRTFAEAAATALYVRALASGWRVVGATRIASVAGMKNNAATHRAISVPRALMPTNIPEAPHATQQLRKRQIVLPDPS
jgi:hypothetical protein